LGASLPAALLLAALPVHVVPFGEPEAPKAAAAANGQLPQCRGRCNVQYWGGRVISNVKVYAVLWGSGVDEAIQSGIGDFFTALTNSDWMDWQNEYRTDVAPAGGGTGTGQLIGRGTFAGPAFTIAPSPSATCDGRSHSNPLPDTAIQSELVAQIEAGVLPPPDANTLYMLFFPPGCVISSDGLHHSCAAGGFCAYHGTLTHAGESVFYGVMPDFGPGSGCDLGCGRGTAFENVCSATSHELGEALSDAEVGLASTLAPPLAWYDENNGENGDMCNQVTGSITSLADGATAYTVQQMYSQKTGLCQQSRTDADDFKVFMNPNTAAVAAGGTATVPVATASTSGAPGALRLALGPLPAGVTGAFDSSTVSAGQTTNLRLSASTSTVSTRDAVVVVTGCAGPGTCPSPGVAAHTASLLLQVTGSGPPLHDFSIAVAPRTADVLLPGKAIQYQVSTLATSGQPESISLTASGLPPGATGTFDASPVVAGGTATLTLAASVGAAPSSPITFTVKGASASVPAGHAATAQVQVHGLPSVDLSVPGSVPGVVPITATAIAGVGTTLSSLKLAIDGQQATVSATSPLTFAWDTTALQNGTHVVVATALDADGGARSAQASVVLTNDFTLALAPASTIATIGSSPVTLTVSTGPVRGAEPIALQVSGLPAGVKASLDRSSIVAGSSATLTLTAPAGVARGRTSFTLSGTTQSKPVGHQASASVLLAAPPSAAILAPSAGTVSGTVKIDVDAIADAGLARIEVKDGDSVLGSGSSSTIFWDTTRVRDGAHALSATVVDGAGNSVTSPVVAVTVANAGGCSSGASGGVEALGLLAALAALARRRAPVAR
jgi:hypothetical protein